MGGKTSPENRQFFEAYGFCIPIGADGRRLWPDEFKKYVVAGLEKGNLTVAGVVDDCNMSEDLVYSWRKRWKQECQRDDVDAGNSVQFSEIKLVEETESSAGQCIVIKGRNCEVQLPVGYAPEYLCRLVASIEGLQ